MFKKLMIILQHMDIGQLWGYVIYKNLSWCYYRIAIQDETENTSLKLLLETRNTEILQRSILMIHEHYYLRNAILYII